MKRKPKPVESIADFKARLAAMLLPANRPIGGAAHSHPCVVRKPTDRGYYPPTRKVTNGKR
jgi:hypothetical protein